MEQSFRLFTIFLILGLTNLGSACANIGGFGEQPLSKIAIEKATLNLHDSASVKAFPPVIGLQVRTSVYYFDSMAPTSIY